MKTNFSQKEIFEEDGRSANSSTRVLTVREV